MTPRRDSPTSTVDERVEQLFLDNVEVWSTLVCSPTAAVNAAAPSNAEVGACRASTPLPHDVMASALSARRRLAQWAARPCVTWASAQPSTPQFVRARVAER